VNWIRIAVVMKDDVRITRIAEACRVRPAEAIGCIVNVLVELPAQARDGDVSQFPDRLLEQWAMWEGKRGVFAAAFRAHMVDDAGVVRSWEKHNGAAIREADAKKTAAAEWRKKQKEGHTVGPTNPPQNALREAQRTHSVPHNVTGRDVTTNYSPKTKVGSNSQLRDIDEAFSISGPVVSAHAHDALRKLLAAQPDPETWARIIVAYASGQSADGGRPTDAGRLAAAVQDYVAQGKHVNGNTGLFRGFVKRAKTPDRGRYNEQTEDERNAEILHDIRAFNERQRMSGDMGLPLKPVPAWANRIDAAFPDGRTHPRQVAA